MKSVSAYPLTWPVGQPRSKERSRSRFKCSFDSAVRQLGYELRRVTDAAYVISSNIPVRQDGLPYSDWARRRIDDPGVAVYFQRKGKQTAIACDRWDSPIENMRAIALTLEALRSIERWGSSELMDRAFTGFAALPAPETKKHWREVLDYSGDSPDHLKARFRQLAQQHHPDRGGDPAKMAEINGAYSEAMAELGGAACPS